MWNALGLRDEARRQVWGFSHGERPQGGGLCIDPPQASRSLETASFSLQDGMSQAHPPLVQGQQVF